MLSHLTEVTKLGRDGAGSKPLSVSAQAWALNLGCTARQLVPVCLSC